MKKPLFLLLLIILRVSGYSNIPLHQAIENGIRINSEILNNNLESKILEADEKIKRSDMLFRLNGGGNYFYKSEKTAITLPDISFAPGMSVSALEVSGGVYHNFDLKISLTQPIFTGYALSGLVKLNEIRQVLNLNQRDLLELMLRGRIKAVFFNYQMLSSQRDSLEVLDKMISNHLKKLEDLYDEDLVGKSQVLETRLKQREILVSKAEVENNLNKIALTFNELTGYDINEIENNYREPVRDLETSMELFIRNHPALRILADKKKMIDISKGITRGKDLPQLAGFAEFHYGIPGINFLGNEWNGYFQGGLELKLNIFDWGRSRKENMINEYNLKKINNQEKDIVRRTKLTFTDLFATLKNLETRIGTYSDMIKMAGEESELKMMMFNEKQISNRDYIDSVLNVENLTSLKKKTMLQAELIKVEINTMIGEKEEK